MADLPTTYPGNRLSFQDAVESAIRHDPAFQAALARVRQAEAESRQTRLLPNPILSLALRFPEGGGKPDIEASVTADLLSLLLKPGRIAAADQRLRKATSEAIVVLLDLISDVQHQYAKVQALDARVQIDEARRGILADLKRLTDARLRGGEAARLDVLTVETEVAQVDTELVSRRSELKQARIRLARLIGQPSSAANWSVEKWAVTDIPERNDQALIKTALERRPELQSVVWELAALGQDMRVARYDTLLDGSQIGADAERSEGEWAWGPGVVLGIPLFDTGQEQRARIRARILEQQHELTRLERSVIQDVRVASEALQSARAALSAVDSRLIPLQASRLDQARSAYRLGSADILAVRLAEQDLEQARLQQVDLQEQVAQASFELARAVGGIPLATVTQQASTQKRTNDHE